MKNLFLALTALVSFLGAPSAMAYDGGGALKGAEARRYEEHMGGREGEHRGFAGREMGYGHGGRMGYGQGAGRMGYGHEGAGKMGYGHGGQPGARYY
jgi:hypothetical protein